MKLRNKSAIITGASRGFGLAIAKTFLSEGANISICSRSEEEIRKVGNELRRYFPTRKIVATRVNIKYIYEIYYLMKHTIDELGKIDILVCNAGIYGPINSIEESSWKDWVEAIEINLLGTVACCCCGIKYLKQILNDHGKIILLSGGGATKPLPNFSAYAASKTAIVRFGETLAEELKEFNIDVNSVAPGALNTKLLDEVLRAGSKRVGKDFYEKSIKQKEEGGTSLAIGTALCVFLASQESNGITGKLISAVWDDWKNLKNHLSDLKDSDIYTLRRIVPEDRRKEWK